MKTLSLILALALPLAAQPTLVNSDQLAAGLATKQDTITNGTITNAMLANGAVANLSGTNTGDQTSVTGNAGTVTTINGRIAAGTNVVITGAGTAASPYLIAATGGGGGGGSGDVTAASSFGTDNRIIRSDGTGKGVQSTGIVVDDTNNMSGVAEMEVIGTAAVNSITLGGTLITANGAEVNALDGITATVDELNRTDGLLSAALGLTDTQTPTNKTLTDPSNVLPAEIGVALSDETTAITTGTAKVTIRMPFAMTLTGVRASLTTVSSSGTPTVDINDGGTTILSTKLTLDASEKTSTTAAAAAVISDTSLADDAEITFDIDVAGTGAAGLKIWLIGTR